MSGAELFADMEQAHRYGVTAAINGMQDAALGPGRITGSGVPDLADAAVTSATPFLRAPLLSRIYRAARLHLSDGPSCPTCGVPAPCPTAQELA